MNRLNRDTRDFVDKVYPVLVDSIARTCKVPKRMLSQEDVMRTHIYSKLSGLAQAVLCSMLVAYVWEGFIGLLQSWYGSEGLDIVWQFALATLLITELGFEFFGLVMRSCRPYYNAYKKHTLKVMFENACIYEKIKILVILQLVVIFILFDFLYRQTIACILFVTRPKFELTTDLLQRWYPVYNDNKGDWLWDRGRLARWFCDKHLHKDDPGHCLKD